MRWSSATTAALASLFLLGAGCAHEPLPWPPSKPDVARINDTAEQNDWFRVEYVEPLASQQVVHAPRPIGIESIDDERVGFRTRAGEMRLVPTEMVTGVTVKERAPGALIGATLGAAGGTLLVLSMYLMARAFLGDGFPDTSAERRPCDDSCVARSVAPLIVAPAVAGAVAGWFVGARKTFDLGPPR